MKGCSNDQAKSRPSGRAFLIGCLICVLSVGNLMAQDESVAQDEVEITPVKNTFESIWLIDAQTVMVPVKGTLEADFQHRFGTWENGYDELYGIFASSNIRLGMNYVPVDRLQVGLGFTKFNNLIDFYGKYAILRQMKGGGSPVTLDYYVNAAIDTREEEDTQFDEPSDRWSFFHQVMVARKFSDKFSLQLSGNLSWFNYKEHNYDSLGGDLVDLGQDSKAFFSASAIARYKFSNVLSVIAAYDQPITDVEFFNDGDGPYPNVSFGLELTTSSHAFQVFIGNYQGLVPQYNHTYNDNNWSSTVVKANGNKVRDGILIGFNITRLWNL